MTLRGRLSRWADGRREAPSSKASPSSPSSPSSPASDGPQAIGRRGGARRGQHRRAEQPMVPSAEFRSYYGRPVIKEPVWRVPEVPGYLFLGGLAGASSALAASAQLAGRPELARNAKVAAAGSISLSVAALVADLGRPTRFLNMLRVFKPTSPMSVGSWLLAAYGPAAGVAAASDITGRLPWIGRVATGAAAALGPGVAAYTAALLSGTSVPAWHEARSELPYVFVGSAATAAGGLGLLLLPPDRAEPARNLAVIGAGAELTAKSLLERRLGAAAEPYRTGAAGRFMEAGEVLTAGGLTAVALAGRNRVTAAAAGAALMTASALTRFGVFYAGRTSARDPKYTVAPQREHKRARGSGDTSGAAGTSTGDPVTPGRQ